MYIIRYYHIILLVSLRLTSHFMLVLCLVSGKC